MILQLVQILHGACPEPTARPFASLRVTGRRILDDTNKEFFSSLLDAIPEHKGLKWKKAGIMQMKPVEEELRAGQDIVLIPIEVLVCQNCGERYYDRKNMVKLEEMKTRLKDHDLEVEEVGKVLRTHAA